MIKGFRDMIQRIAMILGLVCAGTILAAKAPTSKPASEPTPLPKTGEKFEKRIPGTLVASSTYSDPRGQGERHPRSRAKRSSSRSSRSG